MKSLPFARLTRWQTIIVFFFSISCGSSKIDRRIAGELATFELQEYQHEGFNRFEIGIRPFENKKGTVIPSKSYPKGSGPIKFAVYAGRYQIISNYYLNDTLVFSADACGAARNNVVDLAPGHHQTLSIKICNLEGQAQETTLTIEVVHESEL